MVVFYTTLKYLQMKTKLSVSLDGRILDLLEKELNSGRFRNVSHAVEFAVNRLLEEENGGA